jgi:hypothetical protein
MKVISFALLFLLSTLPAFANDIDQLQTKDDVKNFLIEKVNKKWKDWDLFESNATDTARFGKNKFYKLDIDNNGSTDLLIDGEYFFAVIDNGDKTYGTHFIDRGTFLIDKHTLTNIIYKDKIPLLIVNDFDEYKRFPSDTAKSGWELRWNVVGSQTDTLIYKFGDFIEYNPRPDKLSIEEIKFSTTYCYGTCPVFELTIKADRSATFNAIEYNDKKGKFKATIDTASYNRLIQTINYIRLTSLNKNYSVGWTDDQTCTLKIKFNSGQTKEISDYGLIGTYGLQNLYNQLFALRETQKWK